jgi:hypothetical protein
MTLYPLVAMFAPLGGRSEFYPFFDWGLFPRSQDIRTDVVIFVSEVNGTQLHKPTLFYELRDYFAAARANDVRLAKLVQMLVTAEKQRDSSRSAELSRVIEQTDMADVRSAQYDIAVITYHPIKRYRTGDIESVSIVKSGEKAR